MTGDLPFLLAGRLPVRLRWLLLGWAVSEVVAFVLLVRFLGLGSAILLGLATTVLGIVTMRRVGTGALLGVRRAMEGGSAPAGSVAEGMLSGLGALLLILPGFMSDAVGLALAAPSVRRRIVARLTGQPLAPPRRSPAEVVDLGPGEWRPIDRA